MSKLENSVSVAIIRRSTLFAIKVEILQRSGRMLICHFRSRPPGGEKTTISQTLGGAVLAPTKIPIVSSGLST